MEDERGSSKEKLFSSVTNPSPYGVKQRWLKADRSSGDNEANKIVGIDDENLLKKFFLRTFAPIFLVITCPVFVTLLWYTSTRCGGSFSILCYEFLQHGLFATLYEILKNINFLNPVVYTFLFLYIAFQVLLMKLVPGKIVYGPITPKGNQPIYKDNGFYCYVVTLFVFSVITLALRHLTSYSITTVYDHFDQVLTSLNILSILLCVLLCFKGYYYPSTSDSGSSGNIIFDYYWGTELYPRICGVDIKVSSVFSNNIAISCILF